MSEDKLQAINYEIDALIKWTQDRIEYIEASAGIPFSVGIYQDFLAKLVAIKAGSFPNLENMFHFYENRIKRLGDLNDNLEDKLWDLEKKNTNISKAIKLIQEARALALTGEYGPQDVEYEDVKARFDEAVNILQKLMDNTITK
jgi:hypothetical protein